jgi:hypothetical protein
MQAPLWIHRRVSANVALQFYSNICENQVREKHNWVIELPNYLITLVISIRD